MNLQEQIYRIQGLMVTEGKEGAIKSMIEKHGLYHAIKLMGGFDYSMDEYLSTKDKIKGIKDIVTKLCEKFDTNELGGYGFASSNPIIYDETNDEKQVIEYYAPEHITVERYSKEEIDVDVDYDDYYINSFEVPYEKLPTSLITEIFYLMIGEIQ